MLSGTVHTSYFLVPHRMYRAGGEGRRRVKRKRESGKETYPNEKEGIGVAYGKSIELFLVNGTADSLVIAELSNWNGKAIKIPRIEVAACNRDDMKQADDGSDSVYIGEAENVKERLLQHLRDYQSEKEKYYWSTAVIFIGRDLNKAHIRYLENRFVEISKESGRYKILTKNTYRNTVMKESQIAVMEEFIDNVRVLINALGYKVLEPLLQVEDEGKTPHEQDLFISSGNVSAAGKVTSEGFVVIKGARINGKTSAKSLSPGMKKLREKLFLDGKVEDLTTTEDILFSSSLAAADFILGYSVSGPRTWKTEDGRTLKEIEDNETGVMDCSAFTDRGCMF